MKNDNVLIYLSGRYISQDIYTKNYLYSLRKQQLIKPNKIEKVDIDFRWEDLYYLLPGKYLIIETNIDNIQHNCVCKTLKIFTIDDYLFDMKEKSPNLDMKDSKSLYHYGGWEIKEWEGFVPDWVELPCNCLRHMKKLNVEDYYSISSEIEETEEDRQKRISYNQPKEVEDKLAALLLKDEKKVTAKFLIKK